VARARSGAERGDTIVGLAARDRHHGGALERHAKAHPVSGPRHQPVWRRFVVTDEGWSDGHGRTLSRPRATAHTHGPHTVLGEPEAPSG
jgi:hypothetical protein